MKSRAWSSVGRQVARLGRRQCTIKVWDVATGQHHAHGPSARNVWDDLQPRRDPAHSTSLDRTARLWDVATSQVVRRFRTFPSSRPPSALTGPGATATKGQASSSGTSVRAFGRLFAGSIAQINALAFTPDGEASRLHELGGRWLWDVRTGQELSASRCQYGYGRGVYPDGPGSPPVTRLPRKPRTPGPGGGRGHRASRRPAGFPLLKPRRRCHRPPAKRTDDPAPGAGSVARGPLSRSDRRSVTRRAGPLSASLTSTPSSIARPAPGGTRLPRRRRGRYRTLLGGSTASVGIKTPWRR